VISAVRDKLDTSRLTATLAVGVPAAVLSLVLFSTTSGIYVLDVVDHFVNQYGILVVALVSMLIVAWVIRALTVLGDHLNVHGRPRVGLSWRVLTSLVAPVGLAVVLVFALRADLAAPYEDYPTWLLLVCGWLMVLALPIIGFSIARLKWREGTHLDGPPPGSDPAAPLHVVARPSEPQPGSRPTGPDAGGHR
jgi:NSS family neurotransmitter:Na+ symporter